MNQLQVGIIGGLGLMASPMARHWRGKGEIKALRVHDRGTRDERRDRCRQAWLDHGAKLVSTFEDLTGTGDLDGVFICAGKNGDDVRILSTIVPLLAERSSKKPFICHMSTVSTAFAAAASEFCSRSGVSYVNYPITGGPLGAEQAKLLILASGDRALFDRLQPALSHLGTPRHFGDRIEAAAEVKLIGHLMVFNGLTGISSAAATHAECFTGGHLGGPEQTGFFDFLNTGGGGTRQWDIALRNGLHDNRWDGGFPLPYAAIDAIYAAHLCINKGISRLAIEPIFNIILAFSYILNRGGDQLATHAIVREMVKEHAAALDRFLSEHEGPRSNLTKCLEKCVQSLPPALRQKVFIGITAADFQASTRSG